MISMIGKSRPRASPVFAAYRVILFIIIIITIFTIITATTFFHIFG